MILVDLEVAWKRMLRQVSQFNQVIDGFYMISSVVLCSKYSLKVRLVS